MPNFPYPTHIEILRAISKVCGVNAANKKLDDIAYLKTIDHRLFNEHKTVFFKKIEKALGSSYTSIIERCVDSFFDEYTDIVANVDAGGVTRDEMIAVLSENLIDKYVIGLIKKLLSCLRGNVPQASLFFSTDRSCSANICRWLLENESDWASFYHSLNKEGKAKIKAWTIGEHIPHIQSISLLNEWESDSGGNVDWPKVKLLLWGASVIDRAKQDLNAELLIAHCRKSIWGRTEISSFEAQIVRIQKNHLKNNHAIMPVVNFLRQNLTRTKPKIYDQEEILKEALQDFRSFFFFSKYRDKAKYWADWYEARLMVLSGKLDEASELYKQAIELGLYRAGRDQQQVIEEAMVVAASKRSPDKTFLKHLKNANILFKYDIPSSETTTPSSKFSETVENWEIELWRKCFYSIFPTEGMFSGGKKVDIKSKIGPFTHYQMPQFELDLKRPNKKFKIDDKTFPQIVWFSYIENFNAVKALLEAGADVNKLSSSGETALIMSLESLDTTSIYRSLDDALFNLISSYPHKQETLDNRSYKRRLLPMILAVKSGKPAVVRKVIEMGADVNCRGETDLQTPLNIIIKLIGMRKDPKKFWEKQHSMPITPDVLDSARRYNAGMTGMSLDNQRSFLESRSTDKNFERVQRLITDLMSTSIEKNLKVSELREIARLLIDKGADVDAEHSSPLKGYTPLMLAAELDEDDLFNKMLSVGGNPRKTYSSPESGENVDCWRIAEYFASQNVMLTLKSIERFFPSR